jgi:hypothetical protein
VRGHADAETLAAFREELLSRRKAARVSAHLAACSRCAGLDAQLTEVSALLTQSTAPPMPDALASRIEAAIAAEAAARAAAAADGTVAAAGAGTGPRAAGARPSRPPGGPGRSWLALRVAAVTAAVVVVAGGGYGVARLLAGNPGPSTAAGSAAAPAISAGGKAPRLPTGGLSAPGSHAAASNVAPAIRAVSSGTDYQPGQLKAQISAALAQFGPNAAEGSGARTPSPASRPNAQLPTCVTRVTGGKRPLLVDQARYQGHPATVIVIPADRPRTLRALVVTGDCTAATSHVLATTTLPAPG